MSSPSRLLTPSGEPRALRKKELVAIVTDLESENHMLRLRLGLDEMDAGSEDEDTQAASQRRMSEGGGKHEEPEYAKKYLRRKSFAGTYVSGEDKEEGDLAKFQAKENKKVGDKKVAEALRRAAAKSSATWCGCCKGAGYRLCPKSKSKGTVVPLDAADILQRQISLEKSDSQYMDEQLLTGGTGRLSSALGSALYPTVQSVLSNEQKGARFRRSSLKQPEYDWEPYVAIFQVGPLGMKLNVHPDAEGCFVHHVELNSQASNANVQLNHRIVKVGDVEISTASEALEQLSKLPRPIELTFLKATNVLLEEPPASQWKAYVVTFVPGKLGMKLNIHPDAIGCFVHYVEPKSQADLSNVQLNHRIIKVGDVEVSDAHETMAALKVLPRPVELTFLKPLQQSTPISQPAAELNSSAGIKVGSPRLNSSDQHTSATIARSPSSDLKARSTLGYEEAPKKAAQILGRPTTDEPDNVTLKASELLGVTKKEDESKQQSALDDYAKHARISSSEEESEEEESSEGGDGERDSSSIPRSNLRGDGVPAVANNEKAQEKNRETFSSDEGSGSGSGSGSDSIDSNDNPKIMRRKKRAKAKAQKKKRSKKSRRRRDEERRYSSSDGEEDSSSSDRERDRSPTRRKAQKSRRGGKKVGSKVLSNAHLVRFQSKFKMTPPPQRLTWKEKMELRQRQAQMNSSQGFDDGEEVV